MIASETYKRFLDEPIFLGRDLSQAEIRCMAQFSQDKLYIKQLSGGDDIHTDFGVTILHWDPDKIRHHKPTRRVVKELHFGLIYGLQPKGLLRRCLQRNAKTDLATVTKAHNEYFATYTGVRDWIEEAIQYVVDHHRTIPSLFGRSRPVSPDSSEEHEGAFWKNIAVNTPIQGSASDFLLLALSIANGNRECYRLLWDTARLEIHDSFICSPKLRDVEKADATLQYLLEKATLIEAEKIFGVKMLVPMTSEASAGFRLGVMVDYDRAKMNIGQLLEAWITKNRKVEEELVKNPLRHIDARRGA